VLGAEAQPGSFLQLRLQFDQGRIRLVAQQPGQRELVDPAFGTGPVTRSLAAPGALPRLRNLPRPTPANAETRGQLDQTALALVVGLQ